jgi:hypothetical protein
MGRSLYILIRSRTQKCVTKLRINLNFCLLSNPYVAAIPSIHRQSWYKVAQKIAQHVEYTLKCKGKLMMTEDALSESDSPTPMFTVKPTTNDRSAGV